MFSDHVLKYEYFLQSHYLQKRKHPVALKLIGYHKDHEIYTWPKFQLGFHLTVTKYCFFIIFLRMFLTETHNIQIVHHTNITKVKCWRQPAYVIHRFEQREHNQLNRRRKTNMIQRETPSYMFLFSISWQQTLLQLSRRELMP